MSDSVSLALGARQEARTAGKEARPDYIHRGVPALLRRGVVKAITGDSYTVSVTGDSGNDTVTVSEDGTTSTPTSYTQVYAVPDNGTLSVNDEVWLHFDGDQPTIMTFGSDINGWGLGCRDDNGAVTD